MCSLEFLHDRDGGFGCCFYSANLWSSGRKSEKEEEQKQEKKYFDSKFMSENNTFWTIWNIVQRFVICSPIFYFALCLPSRHLCGFARRRLVAEEMHENYRACARILGKTRTPLFDSYLLFTLYCTISFLKFASVLRYCKFSLTFQKTHYVSSILLRSRAHTWKPHQIKEAPL